MDIILIWLPVVFVFAGFSGLYYIYMKSKASKPWNLNFDEHYAPSISVLIPMRNEGKTIRFKLENLQKVAYQTSKVDVILVDDASTDNTLDQVNQFVNNNHTLTIKVLSRAKNEGRTSSLNFALKYATGDIVVVSDADCFWPADILMKALPLLSDPHVGAVAARELLLNPETSWNAKSESFYGKNVQSIRVGESKIHSTIILGGGFAAFKRPLLEEFDKDADDSGTAFNIVQKNHRTLLASDAYFYTTFPAKWRNKIIVKIRRAHELQLIWAHCLKFLFHRRLLLPKRIAIPEIFLHIFNPVLFIVLISTTVLLILEHPLLLFALFFVLPAMVVSRSRIAITEIIQNNLILVFALTNFLKKGKFRSWKPVQESRILLDEKILRERQLI
jgi:cellulose synthase/poly-beta-1,6-N-acetylglucosamine synthase-like glycosyltransferase